MNEIGNFAETEPVETAFISRVRNVAPTDRAIPPARMLRGTRVPFLLCLAALLAALCPAVHGQTGQWDWVAPSTPTTAYGNPGTTIGYMVKGSFDPANYPPARVRASIWVDASDKVWMFGGVVSRSYNDAGLIRMFHGLCCRSVRGFDICPPPGLLLPALVSRSPNACPAGDAGPAHNLADIALWMDSAFSRSRSRRPGLD